MTRRAPSSNASRRCAVGHLDFLRRAAWFWPGLIAASVASGSEGGKRDFPDHRIGRSALASRNAARHPAAPRMKNRGSIV
jgi:hypothetical protein